MMSSQHSQLQYQKPQAAGVSRIQGPTNNLLGERDPSVSKGIIQGEGSPKQNKALMQKSQYQGGGEGGAAFGRTKGSTNIILIMSNQNSNNTGLGLNNQTGQARLVSNSQMPPQIQNARNNVQAIQNFSTSKNITHLQDNPLTLEAQNQANLKGVLSANSFVSTVPSGTNQMILNSQQTKAQTGKFTNHATTTSEQIPQLNQQLQIINQINSGNNGGGNNSENMKPTRIILIDSTQDNTGQNGYQQNALKNITKATSSFNDQSQHLKGIFQGSGSNALQQMQAGKRNSNLRQYEGQATTSTINNNGSSSQTKSYYTPQMPQNENSNSMHSKHLPQNQQTPKTGQLNDFNPVQRHTFGGAGSQMSTMYNNDLMLHNTQQNNNVMNSASNQNGKKNKLQQNHRHIMQGGHDIVVGNAACSSSTPNGLQNIMMPVKTFYSMGSNQHHNGGGTTKNFGDSEEKRRIKQDNLLNEVVGFKKKVSVDCSSIIDQRIAYNQGNYSPTIILKTTIAEQTTNGNHQMMMPQPRIRSFNYQTTYEHEEQNGSNHNGGSTVLQSDESFRRINHFQNNQVNGLVQQLLPRPPGGVRMSQTKESSRQPVLKHDRKQYNHNPQTLIGTIIEGSSIQQSAKQYNRQTSNDKLKKVNAANMNRKHLIHQRIKCQGIPVVPNATQYNNTANQQQSWMTTAAATENNSSTHFSNFRQTQHGDGQSGKNSMSSAGVINEHIKYGNTFSRMDPSIFESIAQTKEFQELAYTLSQIPQTYMNGSQKQQVFDHQETLQMIKNYSSLLMKDSKFRENIHLQNQHQQQVAQYSSTSAQTPYIQYLIKNFKTRATEQYQGSKFGKYYHHNNQSNSNDIDYLGHNTSTTGATMTEHLDNDKQNSLSRLRLIPQNKSKTQAGARSQTSLDNINNSDQKPYIQQFNSDQEEEGTPSNQQIMNQSQYAQSLRVKRYNKNQPNKNSLGEFRHGTSQEKLGENNSPYKENGNQDSSRSLHIQKQTNQDTLNKSSSKMIQSLKRYASKERFQKLLDKIASTAMRDSFDLEGSELFQQRLWEASQWLIQEQLKQRQGGRPQDKNTKNFHLKGTNTLSGTRQVSTPTYGDKRLSNGPQDYKFKDQSSTYMLPMKIQQIQRIIQPQPPTIQEIMEEGQITHFQQKTSSQSLQAKIANNPVKRLAVPKAPLVPNKPKIRLDTLILTSPNSIHMNEINELFSQINRFIMITIKHKDAYSNLQLQEIKFQSLSLGLKLTNQDLQLGFLKSNNFVVMLRSKVSALINKFIIPSFPGQHGIVSLAKSMFSNTQASLSSSAGMTKSTFKFWVENSGNNHQLVKQTCKKRTWLIYSTDYVPPAYGQNSKPIQYDPKPDSPEESGEDYKQVTTVGGPHLLWTQLRRPKILRELTIDQLYNHIDGINTIATKTGLFLVLKKYYEERGLNVFDIVPETYLINLEQNKPGQSVNEQKANKEKQIDEFARAAGNHIWILKPGENTNRGHGIQIFDDVRKIIHSINHEYTGSYKSVVLQKYIPNPYLISKRKFDFRVYALLTYNYLPQIGHSNQPLKLLRGYFYEEGYLRTSCKEFNLKQIHNKYVHLTNDAVQKYSQDYGKFENGNKISYEDFRTLLLKEKNVDFNDTVLPQIKQSIKDVFEAAGPNLIGEIRWDYNGFELMGFDFMLDDDLKLYLIECNTNPCLETQQSILLQRIIPQVLDQTCKLAVDPFLRASEQQYATATEISLSELRYEMIYEHRYPNAKVSPTVSQPCAPAGQIDRINEQEEDEEDELPPEQNIASGEMCQMNYVADEEEQESATAVKSVS